MTELRILIADDHELVRRGLRALLEAQPGWEVVAEAQDGREAVERAQQLKPDVVILDVAMPHLNGLDATRRILKTLPGARVLILTMHDSDQIIREVLNAGARGLVSKTDAAWDLVMAVEAVRRNKTFFTSTVDQVFAGDCLQGPLQRAGREPSRERLTSRQREILQLLAEGKTSKEVAGLLGMSVKTAETHRANIMRRLDCHSLSELVRYAIRNKMIQP